MRLIKQRGLVSVAEIAADAGVSRATAYRYFPSRSRLVSAVIEESLGPVRRFDSARADGRARLRDLFEQTFPRFTLFEPHMRAAMQLALEHWAMTRASVLAEEPFRRGHRAQILHRAAHPLQQQLGTERYERLLCAISLVYGIEPYVVLKDMWGLKDREVEAVARWVLDALLDAALAEVRRTGSTKAATRKGRAGAGSSSERPSTRRDPSRRPSPALRHR